MLNMNKYKNIIIAFVTNLILVNAFAYHSKNIFIYIKNSLIFYLAFSSVTIIATFILLYIYKKFKNVFSKIALCIFFATQIPIFSYIILAIFGDPATSDFIIELPRDINVLIGLGLGSVVLWLPISIIWYLSFENYNINHKC